MTTTTPRRPLGSEPTPPKRRVRKAPRRKPPAEPTVAKRAAEPTARKPPGKQKAAKPEPRPKPAKQKAAKPARQKAAKPEPRPKPAKHKAVPKAEPLAADVHPRIRRRRAEVEDSARRSRHRRVLGVLVALALSLGAAGALFSPLLDLDHIEVRGVESAMEADVAEAAGVSPGEAMVAIDTEEVSSRIEELPSVAHADASLDWSGAMVLKVSPHRPAAFLAVGEEDALHVLTRAGEVVPVGAIETEGMPVFRLAAPIDGLDRHDRLALVTLVDSLDGLYGLSLGDMVAEPGDRYVFAGVGVIEGAEIDLGGLDDLVAKTQALEAMLGGDVDLRCLSRLDVSVPSRVTLLRDAACVERTYAPSPDSSAGAEDR